MNEGDNKNTDKIIRLVEYLTALARINAKIVRTLDEYRKALWIHDIPNEPKYCFTQAWGREEEQDTDVWIEIKKFPEPELPKIPQKCTDWVKWETLRNTKDLPELQGSIVVERTEEDEETKEKYTVTDTLYLKSSPDIQQIWDDYLEKQWMPWTELYNRYSSVQKVYASLFHIYQEQQKLGEQYELVFCTGLLNWKTPSGHEAKRHIIIAKASLEFEPHLGKFTVKQAIDGDQIDIELDMLDVQDQPQNVRQLIELGRNTIGANLWSRPDIDSVLSSIANSLADSGQGEYHPDRIKPEHKSLTKKPIIEFAPSLILRKRSMRGLEQLLLSIKEQVEAGEIIPDEFLDLCESLSEKNGEGREDGTTPQSLQSEEEIYFPLHANEEQRRIIRTLEKQKGVLVQGPPGTGKSHTIANLICHLLATGKRVLVTAKTPRALQVLHDKLPSEIKPLCINLLGQGTEERESLERSVTGILTRLDRREETNNGSRIHSLECRIDGNRRGKSETDNKIMALRESETFTHNIARQYSGTAAQIARDLRKDTEQYVWFTDTPTPEDTLPLTPEEINSLCKDIVDIDAETEKELSLTLPDCEKLPEGKTVRVAFQKESAALKKSEEGKERLDSQEGKALIRAGKENVEALLQLLADFAATGKTVRQRPMSWVEKAVYDVLTDRDTPWKELLRISTQHTNDLHGLATQVDSLDVSIPQDMDRKKVLHDAKALKNHFDSGRGAGVWLFKPKTVREHGDLIGKVKVDGRNCDNSDTLQNLINYLTVEQELNYVWPLWAGKAVRLTGPFPLQVAEIDELHEALENIINLYGKREDVKEKLKLISGLREPHWEDISSVDSLTEDCRIVLAQIDYIAINTKILQLQNGLADFATRSNVHLINGRISKAFHERDSDLFCKLLEEAEALREKAGNVNKKRQLIGKLAEAAPSLAGRLARCNETQLWAERLNHLPQAWAWAQGNAWLDDFLNADLDSLERHSARLDEEIRNDLAELASVKAWQFCFNRMQEEHRRHLMSWQQAMKKLGKGTGKHAHTHRKNAQRHLNECRDAVPAWIMPLHRVYETVDAGAGIFDVIIVDEASQCGPEGLPLMYLGKRVLVVGDDKQISPEAVGVNREQVQQLMRNYLYDFDHADSFDVESSLFDHGRIRFSNRISLREHFRCMPEIIRFSNDLCYRTDPLIPLRQYPPDRLDPLKTTTIQNGYREGTGNRVINRPEADALVEAIENCCRDDRYQGMTMGVIVLQGEAQAYHIEEKLLQKIGAEEMENRRLICGNPYSFQGDERDIIFLSMIAAPNERIGAMTKASDQRRFNVAASRAQDQMWLFHSATMNHLSEQCFRRRLLEHFLNPTSYISQALGEDAEELRKKAFLSNRIIEKAPAPFDSWFEVDVALQIAGNGFRVVPQYPFADKRIDLVVQGEKSQLAVECDGDFWHGADAYTADMERQRKLERCGWKFFRIRESRYYAAPEKALEPLWSLLEQMGILSLTATFKHDTEPEEDNGFDEEDEITEESEASSISVEEAEEPEEPSQQQELWIDRGISDIPEDIHQAIRVKADVICKAIIQVLEQRPKFSSVRENVPTYILKLWNIRSRGNPREQFAKRVDQQIAIMDRKGYVIIYKSKNERVKLGWVKYQDN
ncbi:MAG: AAA family ATPase [Proteobacteria bacterium]|nr:AAA family ATPase [Pseudomonadota bacterium]